MEIFKLLSAITIQEVILALVAIAGWLWAFYKFRKLRTIASKLEIELIPEVYHNVKSKVVYVSIRLKNIGNVAIYDDMPTDEDPDTNSILEAKKVPDKFKDIAVSWDDEKLSPLLKPIKYLKEFYDLDEYKDYPDDPYTLEPGITETVHIVFSTRYHGVILLKATFADIDDNFFIAKKVIDLRVATSHKKNTKEKS